MYIVYHDLAPFYEFMDKNQIISVAKQAFKHLKEKYNLPSYGLLAGGSIANYTNYLISGKEAVITDVDIFKKVDKSNDIIIKRYDTKRIKSDDGYNSNVVLVYRNVEYYNIVSTSNDGPINYVNYNSKSDDYNIIINAFDINCTKLAVDLSNGDIYISDSFVDFINTNILKIDSFNTPHHSAIRLVKKSVDLGCEIDKSSINILEYVISENVADLNKKRFSDKYINTLNKIENKFYNTFNLKLVEDCKINTPDGEFPLYRFEHKDKKEIHPFEEMCESVVYKTLESVLFFYKNIKNCPIKKDIYDKLNPYYCVSDYIDINDPNLNDDVEYFSKFIKISQSLYGMNLKEQCNTIKTLIANTNNWKSILGCNIIDKEIIDEFDAMLMELRTGHRTGEWSDEKNSEITF